MHVLRSAGRRGRSVWSLSVGTGLVQVASILWLLPRELQERLPDAGPSAGAVPVAA